MVGEARRLVLDEILTEKQIHHVLKQAIGENDLWTLKGSEVRPATEGIAGFLGDHMKAVLYVEVQGELKKVHLFIKRIPASNKPKADFIEKQNYFRREKLMLNVLEEICKDGPKPWCVKAYIYTDSIIVMPDLTFESYEVRHYLNTLDAEHIFLTTTSIACFHAAFINYETKKSINENCPYSILQEFGHLLTEPTFYDCPWLKACSKLSYNLMQKFSTKGYRNILGLESKLTKIYIEACDSLTEYKETVNVLLHKDLWVNNIMFKYNNGVPSNALLVDYQCLRYGPPAFDLMIFLYLTTDRSFREAQEKDVFDHYYSIFVNNLSDSSKRRLEGLGYNKEDFLKWCEKARMFGMFETIAIYPYILMDPITAQKTFDDPETFDKYLNVDRSEPVLAHATRCEPYKERSLEVTEEFIERYVLKQL